jgi:hypothetical protein
MFTNSIGQTIVPGDRVLAVVQGYSRAIKAREGVFIGVSPSGSPQVRCKHRVFGYWNAEGKNVGYYGSRSQNVATEYREVERVTTLHAKRVYKLA